MLQADFHGRVARGEGMVSSVWGPMVRAAPRLSRSLQMTTFLREKPKQSRMENGCSLRGSSDSQTWCLL
jgi:hypothetical protein